MRGHRYNFGYGHCPRSNWGEGEQLAVYAEGDVVRIDASCPAFADGRLDDWRPGLFRVVTVLCCGEEEGAFYYRVVPLGDNRTLWDRCSDRLHVIPGRCDFTVGWTLVRPARRREQARA